MALKVTSATKQYLLKMCHLRHRLRKCWFCRKAMFRSQDFQLSVFLIIPWFTKYYVMMSIGTWDNVHFWIYLLNRNSLSHQAWPSDRYQQEIKFSEIFSKILRTGTRFQVLFNFATCSNYSVTNYAKIPVFHFFEKVNKGQWKMVNVNYKKRSDFAILSF